MEHWYALYTKPHKEHHVSSVLESKRLETYLPTIQVRKKGGRKTEPFFSCYLFVRFDPTDALPGIYWTPGLRRIVGFGDQLATVPDEVISSIQKRLAEMGELSYPVHRFRQGDRVAITSGPFRDFEAIFDQSLSSKDRACVLVEFLGRWTPCEVSLDWVQRVH
jgi:transcriptional antiterminator RfaH